MATISLDIPNGQLSRVIDALCIGGGYQDTIGGQPNPVTKAQFAKAEAARIIRQRVAQIEQENAMRTAANAVTQTDIS